MSWLLALIGKLVPALDATTRLVKAARESLRPKPGRDFPPRTKPVPPPPPIGESGARQASEYLRGYGDAAWKRHMDEHNAGSAARLAKALDDDDARAQGIEEALDDKPAEEGEGKTP